MSQYKLSLPHMQRVLSAVAIKNHFNGTLNPYAHFRSEISYEQYEQSRIVSTPLRLYDCAPISDGAALSSSPPTRQTLKSAVLDRGQIPWECASVIPFTAFSLHAAGEESLRMAGLRPQDIDFAEVHDAFTPFEVIGTEDLGFRAWQRCQGRGERGHQSGRRIPGEPIRWFEGPWPSSRCLRTSPDRRNRLATPARG